MVLDAINKGLGINATRDTFHVEKNSIYRWQARLASLKPVLLLYVLCH
jgi:transposase-like protein